MKLITKTSNVLEYRANMWFWKIFCLTFSSITFYVIVTSVKQNKISCYKTIEGVSCETFTTNFVPASEPKIEKIENVTEVEIRQQPSQYRSDFYEVLLNDASERATSRPSQDRLIFEVVSKSVAIEMGNRIRNYLENQNEEPLTLKQEREFLWFVFGVSILIWLTFFCLPVNSQVKLDRNSNKLIINKNFGFYRSQESYSLNAVADIKIEQTSNSGGRDTTYYFPVVRLDNGKKVCLYNTGLYHEKKARIEAITREFCEFLNLSNILFLDS